jgi:hypothetical protein
MRKYLIPVILGFAFLATTSLLALDKDKKDKAPAKVENTEKKAASCCSEDNSKAKAEGTKEASTTQKAEAKSCCKEEKAEAKSGEAKSCCKEEKAEAKSGEAKSCCSEKKSEAKTAACTKKEASTEGKSCGKK